MPHSKYEENIKTFINKYWKENFKPPTIRDISRGCGISSSSVISYALNAMGHAGDGKSKNIIPDWVKKAITEYKEEQDEQ
jgi:hypothetical protein